MNITLRQLRAFVAVAQMGGFSVAAQRLHLTQSALSMLVRGLEADLGVPLFERTTRKVKLTDAGREFFPAAEQLLVGLHEAVSHTRAHAQHGSGRLTMAVTPVFATTVLPAVLAQYRQSHPDVQIVMRDDASPARIQRLVQDGEVDVGVGPIDRSHLELLAVETLMEDQLVLACPIGHRLARAAQVSWRELPPHPLIGFGRDNALQMLVNSSADAAGIALRVTCEVSSISTAVALVEAGLGISVLPSYTRTTGRPRKLHFRPLVEPAVSRALSMMSLRDRAMPPAAQAFMEMLRVEMGRRAEDRTRAPDA